MSDPSPRFTGIFIPVEVLQIEDLTLLDQMLLSWIDALYCDKHGGCFAKNEYLASRLKVQENTIAKSISKLRAMGLIEDVSFDGRNRVIKAMIGKAITKSQSKAGLDLNPTLGLTEIQPRVGQKSKATYIERKEESKEEKEESAKGAHSLSSSEISPSFDVSKEEKIFRQPNVHTSLAEHDYLVAKFGVEMVQAGYEELSEWKKSKTPKECGKASDYGRMKKWVLISIKERNLKEQELKLREERLKKGVTYDNTSTAERIRKNNDAKYRESEKSNPSTNTFKY